MGELDLKCIACGVASDKPRLPRGWKRKGTATYCGKCWCERFVLRAMGVGWPMLRTALREAWADATACCEA